jgi:hypothetical protein
MGDFQEGGKEPGIRIVEWKHRLKYRDSSSATDSSEVAQYQPEILPCCTNLSWLMTEAFVTDMTPFPLPVWQTNEG